MWLGGVGHVWMCSFFRYCISDMTFHRLEGAFALPRRWDLSIWLVLQMQTDTVNLDM